jgi:hypothetical protein
MSAYAFPAPNFDMWMPFNFGQFLRKIAPLTSDPALEYVQALAADWIEKKARAHAKASWAAQIRWARKKGRDPSTLGHSEHVSSIGIASLLSSEKMQRWIASARKRSEKARRAAKARWAKKASAPSIAAAGETVVGFQPPTPPVLLTKNLSSINPLTPFSPDLLPQSSPNILQSILRIFGVSEGMEKPGNSAVGAGLAGKVRETLGAGVAESVARSVGAMAPEFSRRSDPQKQVPGSDVQFEFFRAEVLAFWRGQNPGKADCPWIRSDRRALHQFIEGSPTVTLDQFRQLLRNRAQSEVNPSELPRRWLRDLMEYADGPLNRFKKPLQGPRQF